MTVLHWYALVGVPLILLAAAWGATRLAAHDSERDRRHHGPAE